MGETSYTNLVFEGGGVKGVAYVGALEVLEERGILAAVVAVAGTSAGAITASLVAAGYGPADLRTILMDLDLTTFEDGGLEGPFRLVEDYGWYRGKAFLDWLEARLAAKLGRGDVTFSQLQAATGRDLRVVATDLTTSRPQVFSPGLSPDVAVAEAVRMSMSIPFFFAAVTQPGAVYVDGGTVWNYPIEIFDPGGDAPGRVAPGEAGPGQAVSGGSATLGFRLENLTGPPPPPLAINDIVGFTKALYEAVMAVQDDYYRRSADDVDRTVVIDDLGIPATDFSISAAVKAQLVERGAAATSAFLDGRVTGRVAGTAPLRAR